MQTLGIHHVSINVNDVPAAEHFYCDVLGLAKLPRPDLGFDGAWLQTGQQQVHLLGKSSGTPLPEQHYAFLISDADALLERLAEHNIKPRSIGEIPGICRQIFVHDPSGNLVEFNQPITADAR
ncbi:MAG: VOC family protein [Candidatus Azotimanducaceae bacterium]|jgi:catechol 2,3-dioxygenase-like lactoylglutathione lyase family enzyme